MFEEDRARGAGDTLVLGDQRTWRRTLERDG
jgi:hypothetical protein